MPKINNIFERLQLLTKEEHNITAVLLKTSNKNEESKGDPQPSDSFYLHMIFLRKLFKEIDDLSNTIRNDDTILISVKNQKLLRTCFQLIAAFGISSSLLPGLGINLSKRCLSAALLPPSKFTNEEKYEMLVDCTDFFIRSYTLPVLKNIIITFHLSDYLAALIQLSFAPLKKPGKYTDFIMTQEMYDKLNKERQKYIQVYENLVINCFQPLLMKELLVLQSVTHPSPPPFVKRVIAKEMTRRLLVPGGLLSLIRCFIECHAIDTGTEWKKIDMICKIISTKHGCSSVDEYLENICSQLLQLMSISDTHYLAAAVTFVFSLNQKYPQSECVKNLMKEIFHAFDYNALISKSVLPNTLILSPQEVEQKINILHACICTTKQDWPVDCLHSSLYVLFLLGVKCIKSEQFKIKLRDTVLKCLEQLDKNDIAATIKIFLFGITNSESNIVIEEYEAGLAIKAVSSQVYHPKADALLYFLNLLKAVTDTELIKNVFEECLEILMDLTTKRQTKNNKEILQNIDDPVLLDESYENYANILQLLTEMSNMPEVISSLKSNPSIVLNFIEHFILKNHNNPNEECVTIVLVLLNTVLSNSNITADSQKQFSNLIPVLKSMADDDSSLNSIICKEALSVIESGKAQRSYTLCEKAICDIFDHLLPVRAHGIIELTKLIDAADPETISKKHYILCLLQEQLNNPDSYIYLSTINGIASLCTHCTEDVLQILCREFLQTPTGQKHLETKESINKLAELRMKIGDIIVKVTKRLGDMAVIHKTILLNTMLCGCRDDDPLIRTSALSNLAEIALVLHYRIGSIIYELLLCLWNIIETDKAIECQRAAVMVISSLLKGLGKETLAQLKDNLLPIYRTLKNIYLDHNNDSVLRLHAQIALEELNDIVNQFLFPELKMEKQIFVLDTPENVFK